MSDRAEMRGPASRRRRTTITGGANAAAGVKQANGAKWHDHGEKAPQGPAKAKTDEALRHASNNCNVDARVSGKEPTNVPRGQKSVVDDLNDRLRYSMDKHTCHTCLRCVIDFCSCFSVFFEQGSF